MAFTPPTSEDKRQGDRYRVDKLPDWLSSKIAKKPIDSSGIFPELNSTEMADLAQALDRVSIEKPLMILLAIKH
ncbi:MAG: hypothetical protein C6Y22_05345 [Hapalosiphonaceae cyanobacterium JJU2]|nr:MAG: hypothetical protein C6Y22_05345 [Hapalosiphonaceae cyanobacterium JJU2]